MGSSCSGGRAAQWSQQARHAAAHSAPQICHRNPPLSPAPRPPSITTRYRDARQAQAAPGRPMPASQPQRLHQSEPRDSKQARGVPGKRDGRSAASTVCHETPQNATIWKFSLAISEVGRTFLFKKTPSGVRLISTRRRPPRGFCHTSAHVSEGKFRGKVPCPVVCTAWAGRCVIVFG